MTSRDQGARRARKFGHLRSLVHGAQTPGTWLAISALLAGWSAEELAEVLVYVEHGLRAWPASLRVMPSKPKVLSSWLERPALWRLVGALRLSSPWELERYLDGDWSGLEQLSISIKGTPELWVEVLARWEGGANVSSLELHIDPYARIDVAPLLKLLSRRSWRLTALSFDERSSSCAEDLTDVWTGEWLKELKRLEVWLSRALLSSFELAIWQGAFGALEVLRVQGNFIFQDQIDTVNAPIWSGLKELSHVASDGWIAIEGLSLAGATPQVLELQLAREDARLKLLASPLLEGLERVKLSYSPILSQVLPPLVEHASQLRSLTLHSGQLLGEPPALTGLAQLDELVLISTAVEGAWAQWLVSQGVIARLKSLQIFHHTLAAMQVSSIIEALYEPGEPLRALSLSYCDVGAQSLFKIVDSGRLERCEQLVLSNNSFKPQDRLALMDLFLSRERLPALQSLSFGGNYGVLADDDVRLLKARFNSFVS